MKNLFFLLFFVSFLCSCVGSPTSSGETSVSLVSEVRDEDKTAIELIREISLLYDKYYEDYRKYEADIMNNGRTSSDLDNFVRKTHELENERNRNITKKMNVLKGKEIPIVATPDSLFDITGGKIRGCALKEFSVALKMTFFVKLKKDFIPDFFYAPVTHEYYAPKIPDLKVNLLGTNIKMSTTLFNFEKAKREAVRGQVYAPVGYECHDVDSGITFIVDVGQTTLNRCSNLTSIELSIDHRLLE